ARAPPPLRGAGHCSIRVGVRLRAATLARGARPLHEECGRAAAAYARCLGGFRYGRMLPPTRMTPNMKSLVDALRYVLAPLLLVGAVSAGAADGSERTTLITAVPPATYAPAVQAKAASMAQLLAPNAPRRSIRLGSPGPIALNAPASG